MTAVRKQFLLVAACFALTFVLPSVLSRYGFSIISDWTLIAWIFFGASTMSFVLTDSYAWWLWPTLLHRPHVTYEDTAPPKFKLLEGAVRAIQPLRPGPDGAGPCVFAVAADDALRRAEAERTDVPVAFVLEQSQDESQAPQHTLVVAADWRSWSRYEPAFTSLRYITPWLTRVLRRTDVPARQPWICIREGESIVIWAHAHAGVAGEADPHYRVSAFHQSFTLVTEQGMPGREFPELDGAIGLGTLSQQRKQLFRLLILDSYWGTRILFVVALVSTAVEILV